MKKWFPLFSTQLLGVFNDNFLKNAIIFISIFWLAEEDQGLVIPVASALLVIPFVFLSPLAGKMSQTRSKQKIYEIAKLAEIPIMVVAVVGFYMESMWIVMLALLLMGIQSALYAPSKYGLIRDVGGPSGLSFGVGTMELLTFLGVLIGQIAAGLISDMSRGSTSILSGILIGLAVFGYLTSRMIKVKEEKPMDKSTDPVDPFTFTYKTARWASSIKGLNTTILGLGGFWLVAAMIQMNIYEHAPEVYNLSNTETSIVMALIAIGIGMGCFLAGKLSKNRVELGMVPLGGLGLSITLTIFATTELSLYPFVICLVLSALFAGFYKVPLSAWIQERVEGRKLGLALAYNQLMAFLFILIAAGIFGFVVNRFDTFMVFAVLAVISWIMTIITMANIPAMLIRFIAYIVTHVYFKIEIRGANNLPTRSGALLVANHLSLMDPFLVVAAVPRMLRFVMARGLYEIPVFKPLLKRLNMIPISGKLDKDKLEEFNEVCRREVNNGHVLCIFPEGQISRVGHMLEFKKGIEHIAKGVEAPIIPVQMTGVHGTFLSFNVGSSKPITSFARSFRKHISINIGDPLPANSKATMIRQKVQYLNALNIESRIREHHTFQFFMKRTVKKWKGALFQAGNTNSTFKSFESDSLKMAVYWKSIEDSYVGIDMMDESMLGIIHASCIQGGKIAVFFHPAMNMDEKKLVIAKYQLNCIVSDHIEDEKYISHKVLLNTSGTYQVKSNKSDTIAVFWEKSEEGSWFPIDITHANFLAAIRGYLTLFENNHRLNLYSHIPRSTCYGNLSGIWLPYFFGLTVFHPEDSGGLSVSLNKAGIEVIFGEASSVESIIPTDSQKLKYVITGMEPLSEEYSKPLQDKGVFVSRSLGIDLGGVTVALNTPDYEVTGIEGGKPLLQEGNRDGSFGRMLPGFAIKITNDKGEELNPGDKGNISFFGASLSAAYKDDNGWVKTSLTGYIDEGGFVFI